MHCMVGESLQLCKRMHSLRTIESVNHTKLKNMFMTHKSLETSVICLLNKLKLNHVDVLDGIYIEKKVVVVTWQVTGPHITGSWVRIWNIPGSPVITSGLYPGRLSSHPAYTRVACHHIRPIPGSPVITSGLYPGRLSSHPACTRVACHHIRPIPGSPVISGSWIHIRPVPGSPVITSGLYPGRLSSLGHEFASGLYPGRLSSLIIRVSTTGWFNLAQLIYTNVSKTS